MRKTAYVSRGGAGGGRVELPAFPDNYRCRRVLITSIHVPYELNHFLNCIAFYVVFACVILRQSAGGHASLHVARVAGWSIVLLEQRCVVPWVHAL